MSDTATATVEAPKTRTRKTVPYVVYKDGPAGFAAGPVFKDNDLNKCVDWIKKNAGKDAYRISREYGTYKPTVVTVTKISRVEDEL
jgi:hypothetical protein